MKLAFIDEAGYTIPWDREDNLESQPFYTLSAVVFPTETIPNLYEYIRKEIDALGIPSISSASLGRGIEIKGREVARGVGYWGKNEGHRNAVRNLFLETPLRFGGIGFLVVIDKQRHKDKYATPADPFAWAIQLLFERIQQYLDAEEEHIICIYDQNKREEDSLHAWTSELRSGGSTLMYFSKFYDQLVIKSQSLRRILDFTSGRSQDSIGLQIADFFASMSYAYLREGRPSPCGWWDLLEKSLLKDSSGNIEGYGYKEFPDKE